MVITTKIYFLLQTLNQMSKQHLSLCTAGHVDSGKSSLCGRLIFELGGISEREMQKLREEADRLGKSSFSYAFYMDTQKAERERGITISTTTREFFTDNYHVSLIDNPGHRDFIKNMISGSSQCDAAILLIPCDGGFVSAVAKGNKAENEVMGQSRQHARILNLIGVKQLIIGLNKMDSDTAKYSEERYNEVKNEVRDMLIRVGWNKDFVMNSVPFIPFSAWKGDNLLKKSENMPWWNGVDAKAIDGSTVHVETLFDAIDKFLKVPKRPVDKPLRAPISGVHQIKGVGTVLTSRVETGVVKPGMEVIFLPSHTETNPCCGKIFTIEMHHKSIPEATCGDNIGMNIKGLSKDYMPKVGDVMILKSDTTLKPIKRFTAQVQVLDHGGELKPGYTPVAFCRTDRSACKIVEIKWKMGKETGNQKMPNPPFIKQNEAAEIIFEPQQGFVVEPYDKCEALGRVCFLDSGTVVMVGKVIDVEF